MEFHMRRSRRFTARRMAEDYVRVYQQLISDRHCEEPRSGDEAIQGNARGPWIASSLRSSQ